MHTKTLQLFISVYVLFVFVYFSDFRFDSNGMRNSVIRFWYNVCTSVWLIRLTLVIFICFFQNIFTIAWTVYLNQSVSTCIQFLQILTNVYTGYLLNALRVDLSAIYLGIRLMISDFHVFIRGLNHCASMSMLLR